MRNLRPYAQLLRLPNVWLKLSAPYRVSKLPDYSDTTWLDRTLMQAAPDHMLWASDWPFTQHESTQHYATQRAALDEWIPDAKERQTILCDTPRSLFRF